MLEYRDERRGHQLLLILVAGFENIQADRIFVVRGIKIHDFVRAVSGNEIENVLNEFSVRVNHAYAMAFAHVADRHIFEKRRFARTLSVR